MSKSLRLVSLVACVLLLASFGCRRGQPETTDEPTEEPSPTPAVESLGEFQLVGSVEQAFVGVNPDIDLSSDAPEPLEGDAAAERAKPTVGGVMRVSLEAFSDNLRERCAADVDDEFNLFWTTDSLFDPLLLSLRDVEVRLDGRTLGIIGTVFMRPEGGDENFELPASSETPSATTTPEGTPGPATGEGEQNCVLRAEQIGTSTSVVPSPRATTRPRASASPTATPTPTRRPSPTPTKTPTPKPPSPSPSPVASPSPSVSP